MRVSLLSRTDRAQVVVAAAAKTCTSSKSIDEIYNSLTEESIEKLIDNVIASGHHSVLEHASYTFAIEGVSRALLAQLTRHRIGVSFSVRSQRYVSMEDLTPDDLLDTTNHTNNDYLDFRDTFEDALKAYKALIKKGAAKEDARMVLPNATPTSLVMTMNAREIYHFCGLRMCSRAQTEIRILANHICTICQDVDPLLFKKLGPHCKQYGYCPEGKRSCGIEYTIEEYKAAMSDLGQAKYELSVMKL